jgi:hypothetical protein
METLFRISDCEKEAKVAGNINMEDAKMGGITPAVLIFNGKCVV